MEMHIGANIKRLRSKNNITQEQLSVAMNVSCAAVSKWERGDTYPDITLLQPLAYYFGVTLDELMGYDQDKIQQDIENVIALYKKHWVVEPVRAREIIFQAYRDFPNDYRIMHFYMWNIVKDADCDNDVVVSHKDEFLAICEKILDGCTNENIRLNAWNMKAKILHAEGKTEEALEIYRTKFANWFLTQGQKSEMLFSKDTDEFYYWLRKNMLELVAFAGDKLALSIFYDKELSTDEKSKKALHYGELIIDALNETNDVFFAGLGEAFLSRIRNKLTNTDATEDTIVSLLDMHLFAAKKISDSILGDEALHQAYFKERENVREDNFLDWVLSYIVNPSGGRRADLLKSPDYKAVIDKYR